MLFNKKSYYSHITTLESITALKIIIINFACIILAIIINKEIFKKELVIPIAIGLIIGIITSYILYVKEIIKTEEMRMKLDIYEKIMKENKE